MALPIASDKSDNRAVLKQRNGNFSWRRFVSHDLVLTCLPAHFTQSSIFSFHSVGILSQSQETIGLGWIRKSGLIWPLANCRRLLATSVSAPRRTEAASGTDWGGGASPRRRGIGLGDRGAPERAVHDVMESAGSDRKRACPFADRGDDERGAGSSSSNNDDHHTSSNSGQGSDSARVRLVEASGCDGRYTAAGSAAQRVLMVADERRVAARAG